MFFETTLFELFGGFIGGLIALTCLSAASGKIYWGNFPW